MIELDVIQDAEDFLSRCRQCTSQENLNNSGKPICANLVIENRIARLTYSYGIIPSLAKKQLKLSEPCIFFEKLLP